MVGIVAQAGQQTRGQVRKACSGLQFGIGNQSILSSRPLPPRGRSDAGTAFLGTLKWALRDSVARTVVLASFIVTSRRTPTAARHIQRTKKSLHDLSNKQVLSRRSRLCASSR